MGIDWDDILYRQKLLGKSRYRFLEKNVIKTSDHIYKSGLRGVFFSDFDMKTLLPESINETINLYLYDINEIQNNHPIDVLAFIDKKKRGTVGAISFSMALSHDLKLPHLIVRPGRELTVDRIKIPGDFDIKGKRIVLITDHITTSVEVTLAIKDIQKAGGIVTDVVTHTVMSDFLKEKPNDFPNLIYHHKLPDDIPFELKNKLFQKKKPDQAS